MIIAPQRHLFDLPRDICYLNAAYMTPQTKAMRQSGYDGIDRRADAFPIRENDFFDDVEKLRGLFARLIDSNSHDVAIINAASYGLAIAAHNIQLRAGQHILMLENQFPSNAYVWIEKARRENLQITTIKLPADHDITAAINDTIDALGSSAGIVALPAVHWSTGLKIDLVSVSKQVKQVGAKLVLDITQSLGAQPFSVKEVKPDFMVASGYKWLFCPYGISFCYLAPHEQEGRPLEEGWINREGSDNFAALVNYQDRYQIGARRFDMGERASFGLIPQAITSIEQILEWAPENISETLKNYNAKVTKVFNKFGFNKLSEAYQSDHLLCVRCEAALPDGIVDTFKRDKVYLSLRGQNVRIAPHLYNDDNDLEILANSLANSFA